MPQYDQANPVSVFINRAIRTKMLSREEEIELANAMQSRSRAGQAARDKLIEAHIKLAINVARKFTWTGMPLEDLIQEGTIGLMQAANKFEVEKGYRFSTYARWWVFQAIKQHAYEQGREIRIPESQHKHIRKMNRIIGDLSADGHLPTDLEVAEAMDVDVETVQELAVHALKPISINLPVGEEGSTELGDLLEDKNATDPEEELLRADVIEKIHNALDCLNGRERYIIAKRFDLDGQGKQTLGQLSDHLGITRERVRQIQVKALEKLGASASKDVLGTCL